MEIRLIAGKGGDGRSTFSKTFQNPFGGPNGGDGGNGAHIILQGNFILQTAYSKCFTVY